MEMGRVANGKTGVNLCLSTGKRPCPGYAIPAFTPSFPRPQPSFPAKPVPAQAGSGNPERRASTTPLLRNRLANRDSLPIDQRVLTGSAERSIKCPQSLGTNRRRAQAEPERTVMRTLLRQNKTRWLHIALAVAVVSLIGGFLYGMATAPTGVRAQAGAPASAPTPTPQATTPHAQPGRVADALARGRPPLRKRPPTQPAGLLRPAVGSAPAHARLPHSNRRRRGARRTKQWRATVLPAT